jgi:hypothetical protein
MFQMCLPAERATRKVPEGLGACPGVIYCSYDCYASCGLLFGRRVCGSRGDSVFAVFGVARHIVFPLGLRLRVLTSGGPAARRGGRGGYFSFSGHADTQIGGEVATR